MEGERDSTLICSLPVLIKSAGLVLRFSGSSRFSSGRSEKKDFRK